MRGFFCSIITILLPCIFSSAIRAGDWDFTTEDYARLTASGSQLSFSEDSHWIPEEFRENIAATLRTVLDPKANKRNTWGVTPRDFFHGHIVCRKPNFLSKQKGFLSSAIIHRQMNEEIREVMLEYADDDWNWDVSMLLSSQPKAIEALPALKRSITSRWENYLRQYLPSCKSPAVVYHTFEFAHPSDITSDDPRRHLETIKTGVGQFKTREIATQHYWNTLTPLYDEFFEFQFLIDEKGVIYLQPGTDYFFLTMPGFTLSDFKRTSATTTSLPEDKLR